MKELIEDKSCLLVKQIEDSDLSRMHTVLGITEERALELQSLLRDCYTKTDTVTDCIIMASKHLKHANELFIFSFMLGQFTEHIRGSSMGSLTELLKQLRKH